MARAKRRPLNPYIAGNAIAGEFGFFGREDIFQLVEEELVPGSHQNAVVLIGQRRIGKTSILLQLKRRLPSPPFVTIYFDLMGKAQRPLGEVLYELSAEIAMEIGTSAPNRDHFAGDGRFFRKGFLPATYKALGGERRLILLFDEFDVLDIPQEERLPEMAAVNAFFPYIRDLMIQERGLGFVCAVGRKTEELSPDFLATVKGARPKKVWLLDEESTRALVLMAQSQGSLYFTPDAVDRILALSSRHPYITQLICHLLFNRAHTAEPSGIPTINLDDVNVVVPNVLEAGDHAFQWIWDGLPPAERIIFSAVAQSTDEGGVLREDEIVEILRRSGIRILLPDLRLAPRTLVSWDMLESVNGGYRFYIELFRRWVARYKPLEVTKDELDRVDPEADLRYRIGERAYRRAELPRAIEEFRQALEINPYHLKARLGLAEALRDEGDLEAAIREFEAAYEYDDSMARHGLARALLERGGRLTEAGKHQAALRDYERALTISPDLPVARERQIEVAEELYSLGLGFLGRRDWQSAIRCFEGVLAIDPGYEGVTARLQDAEKQLYLADFYGKGQRAFDDGMWEEAIEHFEKVVSLDRSYKDAAVKLREAEKQKELPILYELGLQHYGEEAWSKAIGQFEKVVSLDPYYRDAAAMLVEAKRKKILADDYILGLESYNEGDWEGAIERLKRVVLSDRSYKDAAIRLEYAKKQLELARLYKDGMWYFEDKNWRKAIKKFGKIVSLSPTYKDAAARLREVEKRLEVEGDKGPDLAKLATTGAAIVGIVSVIIALIPVFSYLWPQPLVIVGLISPTSVLTSNPTLTPASIVTLTPSLSSSPSPTHTPTQVSIAIAPSPTPTPVPTSTPTVTPPPTPYAVVNAEALNLRSGPGTVYDILGVLGQGDPLKVTGRGPAGDWLKVIAPGGQEGWVAVKYLEVNTPLVGIAVAQAPPTPTPAHTPTLTPTPTPESYPKPSQLQPEDGASFAGWVSLEWQWDGELEADEYFSVRASKEGEIEPCFQTQTKNAYYSGTPGYCSDGKLYWQVIVVRRIVEGPPPEWEDLSEISEARWFYFSRLETEGGR